MIALGWTARGAVAPSRLKTVDQPHFATVATMERFAATPRDRIRLQVVCARALPTFLPLAPNWRVSLDGALDHACRRGDHISARLQDLRGLVQLSLRVDFRSAARASRHAEGGTGRDWLAARALELRTHEAARIQVSTAVRAILCAWSPGRVKERHDLRGLQIDALVPTAASVELGALARDLRRVPGLGDATIVLTGPWPALSFTGTAGAGAEI